MGAQGEAGRPDPVTAVEDWPLTARETETLCRRVRRNQGYADAMLPLMRALGYGGGCDPDGRNEPAYSTRGEGRMERLRFLMTSKTLYDHMDWGRAARPYDPVIMLIGADGAERMTAGRALELVAGCDRDMASMPDRRGLERASCKRRLNLDRDSIRVLSRGWTGGRGGAAADGLMARLHDQNGDLWHRFRMQMDPGRVGSALDSDVERMLVGAARWDVDAAAVRIAGRELRAMVRSAYRFDTMQSVVSRLLSGPDAMRMSGSGALAAFLRTVAFLDGMGASTSGGRAIGREAPAVTLSGMDALIAACSGVGPLPADFVFETMLAEAGTVDGGRPAGIRDGWLGGCRRGEPGWRYHPHAGPGVAGSPMPFCGLTVVDDGTDADGPADGGSGCRRRGVV